MAPAPGSARRVEFEYARGGTLARFVAYDVHRAHVLGSIAPKTGIAPFNELVKQVMTTEPYVSARRVFWVVDNGSSHNSQRSTERMTQAWPTATLGPANPPGEVGSFPECADRSLSVNGWRRDVRGAV